MVGAIVPWNFPFEVTIQKVGQALATGNTMIVKPAPDTPWNATRLGRLVAEHTDIPAGVFNVVASSDHLVGEELVLDPRVDLISFTGSTATGRRIMEKGAATIKRLFLELGGKSADIVLDDVDFASHLPAAAAVCMHGGQGCAMPTRHARCRGRATTRASRSSPRRSATCPTATRPTRATSRARRSARSSASACSDTSRRASPRAPRLVVGGGRPAHLDKGWFVEPTLFADVDNAMTIAREEIFGPVLVVIPFEDDDDAVRIANDNQYGLAGSVTSASEERALAVASRIRAGMLSVNGGVSYGADAPFGGYKASGVGRQNGLEGFEQYLETKSVAIGGT